MINCFEIVSASVNIATKNNNALKINKRGYENVKSVCQLMDNILRDFNTVSFGVDIAKDCSVVTLSFECNDYDRCSRSDDFAKVKNIAGCVFWKVPKNGGKTKVSFAIPGVWECV